MELDIDRFIFEIECRPAIWDIKCEEYSDRVMKIKQWEEVLNIFTDQDMSIEEKRKYGGLLQKRWRTLRDAFVKERRRLATVTSDNKKIYKHYEQLLFLLPVISTNATHNITANEEDNGTVYRQDESEVTVPQRKKSKSNPGEEISSELVNFFKSTIEQKTQEEDPDRQFMLSLVNDFKRVPSRFQPMVKINILKCIIEAQDPLFRG